MAKTDDFVLVNPTDLNKEASAQAFPELFFAVGNRWI